MGAWNLFPWGCIVCPGSFFFTRPKNIPPIKEMDKKDGQFSPTLMVVTFYCPLATHTHSGLLYTSYT
jgi:hypothetical protein